MKKQDKGAAVFDLFDQGADSQVGEIAFEDSLLAKVQAGDKAGADAWVAQAKAGQVMRIC
jgi:hypothetical protein